MTTFKLTNLPLALPTGHRSRRWWLSAVVALGLAAAGWLVWLLLSQRSLAPPPVHAYEGEQLQYELRRGQFIQTDTANSNNGYSLRITLDKNYLSPAVNSSLTGTIELLNNGRSVKEAPASL
ncbi:MAG: hypothetical protein V1826_02625, partial [bacterium]